MAKQKYHHGDLKNALIAAGIEILANEGVHALSLRKVAQRAGVSHAAPYAHYADKQALIAAISTEGYRRLYETLRAISERYTGDPLRQLVEGAWAYVQFALQDPDHFKITFSGVVEKEHAYPAFVEMSQRSFALVVELVAACQAADILRPGPPDMLAVSVWGLVHGVVSLLLEGQISHTIRDRTSPRELLIFALGQIVAVELTPALVPEAD
jgi:AcrR family transcriptional regulator